MVLVVSEETGDISIADNGQLIRRLSGDVLRTLLQEMLGGKPEDEGGLVGDASKTVGSGVPK